MDENEVKKTTTQDLLNYVDKKFTETGEGIVTNVNEHTTSMYDSLSEHIDRQFAKTGRSITDSVNSNIRNVSSQQLHHVNGKLIDLENSLKEDMSKQTKTNSAGNTKQNWILGGLTGLALLGLGAVGWNQFGMNKTLNGIDTMLNSKDHGLIPIARTVNNTNKTLTDKDNGLAAVNGNVIDTYNVFVDENNGLAAVKKDVLASNKTLVDTFKGETSKQLEEQKKLVSQYSKQAKKTNQLLNQQKTALMDQTQKVMLEIGTSHRLLDDKFKEQTAQLNTAINPPKPNLIKKGPMQLNLYPFNKMDTVTFQDATFNVNGTEKVYPTAMKGRLEEILGHTGPNDRVSADESILLFTGNDKSMPAQMYSLAVGNSLSEELNKDNVLDMGIQLSLKRLKAEAIDDDRLNLYTKKVAREVGTYDIVTGGFSQAINTIVKLVKNDSITDDMYRNNPELFDQMRDIRGEAQKVLTQENLTPNDLMNVFNDMYEGFKEVLDPTVSLKAQNMIKPVGALYDPVNNQYLSLEGNKLKVYSKNNGDMFV